MSSSGGHQHSQSRAIPTRTVPISDSSQLPHDYCTTPGGTLFSTTPGGTRIIYDRKFLLDRRNSPMAQTPPCHLPNIPGVTSPGTMTEDSKVEVNNLNNHDGKPTMVTHKMLLGSPQARGQYCLLSRSSSPQFLRGFSSPMWRCQG
ncbi:eukaryotic translation initiation factor 4E-binding protein 2 isoform X1 [Hemicordylus capensis]|uniref:eukaryotic translation initiation factor 4E-binding protein 2 isoform X1 n=1 Tax=Hemicordylus capensis TaxID=884348 RepID=UPI0023026220|nr:eukaryotic translation initiation factor 4E-binding protein 2 isoform X1 [Hemicordylus capensis]